MFWNERYCLINCKIIYTFIWLLLFLACCIHFEDLFGLPCWKINDTSILWAKYVELVGAWCLVLTTSNRLIHISWTKWHQWLNPLVENDSFSNLNGLKFGNSFLVNSIFRSVRERPLRHDIILFNLSFLELDRFYLFCRIFVELSFVCFLS